MISILGNSPIERKDYIEAVQLMINSYLKSTLSRPIAPSIYGNTRVVVERYNLAQKHRKYKLLILLISRITYRQMRQSLESLQQNQRRVQEKLTKMCALAQKNINLSVYLAFRTMRRAAEDNQTQQKMFKSTINLLQRLQKYKMKQCFNKLVLEVARGDRTIANTLYSRRSINFNRKLQKLVRCRKKQIFALLAAGLRPKYPLNKLRIVSIIHKRFQKQLKQQFFSRLSRFLIVKYSRSNAEQAVGDLKVQIEDMSVQLQNKRENISRLQSEIAQIKIEQSNFISEQNISYGQSNNQSKGNKGNSLKKYSFNDGNKSFNSNEGININDISFGSILGSLNKSRTASISKFEPNADCSCGYKARCKKYKTLNESLKNQLEIVKEELEVAKDLNEHFTNEMNNYLSEGNTNGDYQRLKKENKAIEEERDQLREKVFKYQKHIGNLKSQFKIKMQELYRKVRKDM